MTKKHAAGYLGTKDQRYVPVLDQEGTTVIGSLPAPDGMGEKLVRTDPDTGKDIVFDLMTGQRGVFYFADVPYSTLKRLAGWRDKVRGRHVRRTS